MVGAIFSALLYSRRLVVAMVAGLLRALSGLLYIASGTLRRPGQADLRAACFTVGGGLCRAFSDNAITGTVPASLSALTALSFLCAARPPPCTGLRCSAFMHTHMPACNHAHAHNRAQARTPDPSRIRARCGSAGARGKCM